MGLYGDHVLPRIINVACGANEEGAPKIMGADSLGTAVSP